jgi:chromosome segregation ATPase
MRAQIEELERIRTQTREERDRLFKDKENMDDLIKQSQLNVRNMREDKEHLTSQLNSLQGQLRDAEGQLKDQEDIMRDMEDQLRRRQNELFTKER